MREFMVTTQRTDNIGALDFVGKKSQRGDNVGPSLARGCRTVGVYSIFFIFYQFLTFFYSSFFIDLNCFKDATKMHTKILFRLDHGYIYLLNSLQTAKQTIHYTNCLFTVCVRCSMYLQTVAVCTIVHALMFRLRPGRRRHRPRISTWLAAGCMPMPSSSVLNP